MTEGPRESEARDDLDSTAILLVRARKGDRKAINRLFDRYRPRLVALAHGRLPHYQRDLGDTDDLVQITLARAFQRLTQFENRREGAFLAYLRKILLNEIRQEARKKKRRRTEGPPEEGYLDPGETPSTVVARRETFERYDRALARLTEMQREAVVMRVDFGFSNLEIARDLGRPSAGAAHMFVSRAVARVAMLMSEDGAGDSKPDGRSS